MVEEHRIQVLHHMSSDVEDDTNIIIPRVVVFLNIFFRPIIGLLMAVRGMYDGKLSVASLLLSILYFTGFVVVIYVDERFKKCERRSRLVPKVFGFAVATAQLSGALPIYSCDAENDWRTCI